MGTYVFSKTVTQRLNENKYTLVVNRLCTVQEHTLSPNENIDMISMISKLKTSEVLTGKVKEKKVK